MAILSLSVHKTYKKAHEMSIGMPFLQEFWHYDPNGEEILLYKRDHKYEKNMRNSKISWRI